MTTGALSCPGSPADRGSVEFSVPTAQASTPEEER